MNSEREKPGDEASPGAPQTGDAICPDCQGTGKAEGAVCDACGGTGTITVIVGDA